MRRIACVLSLGILGACTSSPPREDVGTTREAIAVSALKPLGQVYVANVTGPLDVETKYLPQVVCCENGAAPKGALEAQAVMARTYMYFSNAESGLGTQAKPFQGTQADQAYHCTTTVSQACRDAVDATRDQISAYTNAKGALILNVSFFVDGPRPSCLANKSCACAEPAATVTMSPTDHPAACQCFTFSSNGLANPAYVTYNWSHTGTAVKGSTIGDPANESNRGCASQNIQACLAYAGWSYLDQLRFFYGQDLVLIHSDGTAIDQPTAPDGGAPSSQGDGGSTYLGATGHAGDGDSGCAIGARRTRGSFAQLALVVLALVVFRRRGR